MVTEIEVFGSGAHCYSLPFHWYLWGWMKSDWRKKGGHMRRIVRIESVAAGIKKLEDHLGWTKCPSPHTRVALKLTVSFRTCIVHCNIFSPLITIHNASEFVYSNSCIAVTIQNQTHAHMNVFSHNDRYNHIIILILYVGTTVFMIQGNYVGYMFRLLDSHLEAYSLQVKSQDAVHTLGSHGIARCNHKVETQWERLDNPHDRLHPATGF
jgi:hypothetical protein